MTATVILAGITLAAILIVAVAIINSDDNADL
jgi:hypothetical protein